MSKRKLEKERVCFWLPIPVHNYLRAKSIVGKAEHGPTYGMGDVITTLCKADNPDLSKRLEDLEKVSESV